jgi:hypothetical protein
MPESFTLNFLYQGVPQEIECTLRVSAFTYQFLFTTDGIEMIVERDDEGNLRAIEAAPFSNKNKKPDPAFIRAAMSELERILQEKA